MRAYRNQHPGLGFLYLALLIAGCSAQASPSDTGRSPEPSASSLASASASDATPSPSEVTSPAHWQPAGSLLGEPTSGTHVHALGDGRVLAVHQDTTAELWDPTTSEWQATAQLNNPRTSFASVALPDGRVLLAS